MEFTTEELKEWLKTTKRVDDVSSYYGRGEWGGCKIVEKDGSLYAVPYTSDDDTGRTEWSFMWKDSKLVYGRHRVSKVEKRTCTVERTYYVDMDTEKELDV